MTPELTSEAWTQMRYDYEHTERPVGDICAEHGISSGTLRDRMRRWGWKRRRLPIDQDGPPPAPRPEVWTPSEQKRDAVTPPPSLPPMPVAPVASAAPAAWPVMAGDGASASFDSDDKPIAERLQGAVARVLPAIEGTLATLGTGAAHPREMERASRTLAALTRTLRELNGLLAQHQPGRLCNCGGPRTPGQVDELRAQLARKLEAFVASRAAAAEREARKRQEAEEFPGEVRQTES